MSYGTTCTIRFVFVYPSNSRCAVAVESARRRSCFTCNNENASIVRVRLSSRRAEGLSPLT